MKSSSQVAASRIARSPARARAHAAVLGLIGSLLLPRTGLAEPPDWLAIDARLDAPHAIEASVVDVAGERIGEWTEAGFGFVELAWRSQLELLADDRTRLTHTVARLYVSHAGAQQAGTFELPTETARSRIRVLSAYVLMPDGGRVAVERDAIQVTDAQVPDLFSDWKSVSVPLHGIVPGAIAILEYRETRDLAGHPMPWSMTLNLSTLVPVLSNEISVRSERPADWLAWSADDPGLDCREGGGVALYCRRGETEALVADPGVRSYYDLIPALVLAESVGWERLGERAGRLVDEKADLSPELEAVAAGVRKRFDTRSEQARELYRIVANEVRYLGFEHGDSAVVPHPASVTWKRRFGDCKDKVTLFVALARALGLDARPVLTSVSRFDVGRLQIPAAAFFDHMIVCSDDLEADGGCVDVTLAGSPPELPFVLQGGIALDLAHPSPPFALPLRDVLWEVGVERDVAIDCEGRFEETVSLRQGGAWGNALRSGLLAVGPSERRQYARAEYARVFSAAAEQPEVRIEGLAALDRPWSFAYAVASPRRVPLAGPDHFYDVDAWLVHSARSLLADHRHHPYPMPGLRLESTTRYALCEDVRIDYLGARLALESRWGSLARTYALEDGVVRVDTRFTTSSRTLSPAELADVRLFIERAIAQTPIQFGYDPSGARRR